MLRPALAALLLGLSPGFAPAADQPPPDSAPPPAPAPTVHPLPGNLPAHRQPTAEGVREREVARYGTIDTRRQQTQQEEVDRLYRELTGRNLTPPSGGR